jgi:hypothetical protein
MPQSRTLRRQSRTKATLTPGEPRPPYKVDQTCAAAQNYTNARRAGRTHPERREMRDPTDLGRIILDLLNAITGPHA